MSTMRVSLSSAAPTNSAMGRWRMLWSPNMLMASNKLRRECDLWLIASRVQAKDIFTKGLKTQKKERGPHAGWPSEDIRCHDIDYGHSVRISPFGSNLKKKKLTKLNASSRLRVKISPHLHQKIFLCENAHWIFHVRHNHSANVLLRHQRHRLPDIGRRWNGQHDFVASVSN